MKKKTDAITVTDTMEVKSNVARYLDGFITSPFDTNRQEGINFVGDYRTRWDSHLGFDRPAGRVTTDSVIDADASKNLRDEAGHGMHSRLRVGIDARVGEHTDVRVVGSASGQGGVDTSHTTEGSKGLQVQRLEEAAITQHSGKWDFTVGRMSESMGVTGYWFNKEYDGARAVWTDAKKQLRVGYGDFRHSTGIEDSAYTHAVYDDFMRAPTVDEFVGTTLGSKGGREELIVPNSGATIGFYQQLKEIKAQEEVAVMEAKSRIQAEIVAPLEEEKEV